MQNKLILGISISTALILSGCSAMLPYRDNFKCEKGKDSGVCSSVSEVYEMSNDMDSLRDRSLNNSEKRERKEIQEIEKLLADDSKNKDLREIANAISIKEIQNGKPVIFKIYGDKVYAINSKNGEMEYSYEVPDNQRVDEYLIKDEKGYRDRENERQDSKNFFGDREILSQNKVLDGVRINNNTNLSDDSNSYNSNLYRNNVSLLQQDIKNDENNSIGDEKINWINAPIKVCVHSANIREAPSCKAKVLKIAHRDEILYAQYEKDFWIKLDDGTYIHKSIVKTTKKDNK